MKAQVIKIGNSQGIRIPKPLLEQCGFGKTVRLEIHENKLVISSEEDRPPRAGWAEAFEAALAQQKQEGLIAEDDMLLALDEESKAWLEAPLFSSFDETEWTWPESPDASITPE